MYLKYNMDEQLELMKTGQPTAMGVEELAALGLDTFFERLGWTPQPMKRSRKRAAGDGLRFCRKLHALPDNRI